MLHLAQFMEIRINFPLMKNQKLNPINIYGYKKINEEYILINSNKKTRYIGLRLLQFLESG